jgi:hypothetical protein
LKTTSAKSRKLEAIIAAPAFEAIVLAEPLHVRNPCADEHDYVSRCVCMLSYLAAVQSNLALIGRLARGQVSAKPDALGQSSLFDGRGEGQRMLR